MKGTYTLIINQTNDRKIAIGKLGKVNFKAGSYAYVGSGLKNLKKRIKRHLREEKSLHWHIDYFLAHSKVKQVIYGKSSLKKECEIAKTLKKDFDSIDGFGSSDCKCNSHLFYSEDDIKLMRKVNESFKSENLEPKKWW